MNILFYKYTKDYAYENNVVYSDLFKGCYILPSKMSQT